MRRAIVLSAALVVAGCPKSGGGSKSPSNTTDDVVIHRHAPKVGARAHVATAHGRKGMIALRTAESPGVRQVPLDVVDKSVREEVVLAADDFRPTRLQVTYVRKTHEEVDTDGPHATEAPVANKTYVVEARDGKVVVTRDGAAAPDEEAEAVIDDYKVLLDPDVFPKDAFSKPIAVGKESPPIAAALKMLLHVSNEDSIVSEPKAVLLGTDGDGADRAAVFQVDVALSHVLAGGLPIRETLELAGEWRLALDGGWPVRIVVEGSTSYESADPARLACEGEGRIALDLRRTYADR